MPQPNPRSQNKDRLTMTEALGLTRDMAGLILLSAITIFTFSMTIPVEETAGFLSLIGMFFAACGMILTGIHLWFAKQQIDRC